MFMGGVGTDGSVTQLVHLCCNPFDVDNVAVKMQTRCKQCKLQGKAEHCKQCRLQGKAERCKGKQSVASNASCKGKQSVASNAGCKGKHPGYMRDQILQEGLRLLRIEDPRRFQCQNEIKSMPPRLMSIACR